METKTRASIISGIAEVYTTYPIDFIKTIRQSNKSMSLFFNNPYRGVTARLVGVVPMRILFWNTIHYSHNHNYSNFKTAILTSSIQTLVDYPVEQITIRKMIYNNSLNNCFKIKTLIPGFSSTLCRNFGFAYIVNAWISGKDEDKDSNFMNGAIGGLLGAVLTHPLDTLKTYYHTNNTYKLPNYTIKQWFTGVTHRSTKCLIAMSIGWSVFSFLK